MVRPHSISKHLAAAGLQRKPTLRNVVWSMKPLKTGPSVAVVDIISFHPYLSAVANSLDNQINISNQTSKQ